MKRTLAHLFSLLLLTGSSGAFALELMNSIELPNEYVDRSGTATVYAVNSVRDLAIYDNRLYANMNMDEYVGVIVARWGTHVLSLCNPINPSPIAFLFNVPGQDQIFVDRYLYTVDADYEDHSYLPVFYRNIDDLADPTLQDAGGMVEFYSDIELVNRHAYFIDARGVQILNLTDPSSPVLVGTFLETGSDTIDSSTSTALTAQDRTLVVAQKDIMLYDVSSPARPRYMSRLGLSLSRPRIPYAPWGQEYNIVAGNNRLYVYQYESRSFFSFDISDPAHPLLLGRYIDIPRIKEMVVSGSYLYAVSDESGLLYKIPVDGDIGRAETHPVASTPTTLAANVKYVYVGTDGNTIEVFRK